MHIGLINSKTNIAQLKTIYVNPESYKRGHSSNKTLKDNDNEVWCDRDDDNNDDDDGDDDVV